MNAISQEITVDLVDQNGWAEVKAKQNDNRVRHLLISLTNKGLSYSIPAGIKIRFQGTKSDGKTFKNDCVALDNKIDVELTEQILAVDGV
ncbi:MAG: BppU family phage baseplate upper protein, partial [Eubacterium sp.]